MGDFDDLLFMHEFGVKQLILYVNSLQLVGTAADLHIRR